VVSCSKQVPRRFIGARDSPIGRLRFTRPDALLGVRGIDVAQQHGTGTSSEPSYKEQHTWHREQ